MRISYIYLICFGILFIPLTACAKDWTLAWYNYPQLLQPDSPTPLPPGCLVQLIADGGKDGVDNPYDWWMSQPDPYTSMQWWLANDCPPVGDDFLVISLDNPTYIIDFSYEPDYTHEFYDGYFAVYYIQSSNPAFGSGVGLYTRFYTAQNPDQGDYYGTVGDEQMGEPFHMYQLDNGMFPTYMVQGGIADQQIVVPEPGMISIFFLCAIAAFLSQLKR